MREKLTTGILQMDSVWNDPAANLEQLDQQLSKLDSTPDILVLPEMWSTGFIMNPESNINASTVEAMTALATRYKVAFVGSMAMLVDGAYRNRASVISSDGMLFYYDKQYLFHLAGEHKNYRAGEDCQSVTFKGWNIKLQICYDLRFPESVRDSSQPDLIIYMANWPAQRISQWKQLLIARAIENQCKVIGCNRVGTDQNGWSFPGASMVVNHDGGVLTQLPKDPSFGTTELLMSDMTNYRERLPFYKDKKELI